MEARPVDLVVVAWSEEAAAERAVHELRVTGMPGILGMLALAVTVDGELRTREAQGRVGAVGAVLDAGLGLMTSGIGWLPLDGAAAARADEARDGGVRGDGLRALGERMARRSSVLLVVVVDGRGVTVSQGCAGLPLTSDRTAIDPGLLTRWATPRARVPAPRPPVDSPVAIRTSGAVMRLRDSVHAG
ncbi:Uncharacterized membrane protein [Blastococcus aggregatus]|uniref:Uncharacterized membrane protein n=1 Tax=Blastococcus aggregatus TaxID=38502 RepID=A0A285V6L8_9ACTN|nr:hypothetical protein [Blastococcus aggregatus]SOC49577.1 Uncharacterized membrane protein [Blastococcus aggregatus]